MKFFGCLIILLAYSELLVHFVDSGSQHENALAVRPLDTGYELAPVARTPSGEFSQYMSRHKENRIYYLCPHSRDRALLRIKKRVKNSYDEEKRICKYAAASSIYRVKMYNTYLQRKNTPIHKYAIGYTIDHKIFKGAPLTTYESLNEKHFFLPIIWVYAYAELKLTFAVSYDIVTTGTKKMLINTLLTYKSTKLFPDKIEKFYRNQESKLKEKLGRHYDAEKHELKLGSLVNENDFIIDRWRKAARYKLHQILVWKRNVEMWKNIQEYARHVGAISSSETTITAGIGKVLTISDSEGEQYIMRWGEGEDIVFIPELYWLAINYYKDRETTGMVIIMHNDLIDGQNVKKICDKNPCVEKNTWIWKENYNEFQNTVYCCKLKPEVLKKLDIEIIHKDFCFYKGDSHYSFPPWEMHSPEIQHDICFTRF